jgi:hypothetical protein
MMIGYSSVSSFQVRLPSGNDQTSLINLIINIRDTKDCVTEFNISSVYVLTNSPSISDLINTVDNSLNMIINNPIVQLLATQNQNTVGQIITSFSIEFNKLNNQSLNKAVSSINQKLFL